MDNSKTMEELLLELKHEMQELEKETNSNEYASGWVDGVNDCIKKIQNKIDILKVVKN